MKKIIFLFVLFVSFNLTAQNVPKTFESAVKVDSTRFKDELFIQAKSWIFKTFNNSETVIQLEDKNAGQILGKGVFNYTAPKWWGGGTEGSSGYIRFSIQLYFKDGKYKYVFTDFTHKPSSDKSFGIITNSSIPPFKSLKGSKKRAELIWGDLQNKVDIEGMQLTKSLKESMETKINDNW